MSLAGGIFEALSSVLTHAFLILLAVVFILLEAADLPKKLRIVLKNPERSLSTIEKFSQDAKRYLVIKTLISAATGLRGLAIMLGSDAEMEWIEGMETADATRREKKEGSMNIKPLGVPFFKSK